MRTWNFTNNFSEVGDPSDDVSDCGDSNVNSDFKLFEEVMWTFHEHCKTAILLVYFKVYHYTVFL